MKREDACRGSQPASWNSFLHVLSLNSPALKSETRLRKADRNHRDKRSRSAWATIGIAEDITALDAASKKVSGSFRARKTPTKQFELFYNGCIRAVIYPIQAIIMRPMNKMVYSVTSVNSLLIPVKRPSAVSFLYDREGRRKYLTTRERRAFLAAAAQMPPDVCAFAMVLAYSGARISEVLALAPSRIGWDACVVVIESLKKRQSGVFRAVPIPRKVLRGVERVCPKGMDRRIIDERIWSWGRTMAWKHIKEIMRMAGINGPQATPKGLRHSLAVTSLQAGVPINLVKRWLGHARLSTTEIYADAIGPEEQTIAAKLWKTF